MESELGKIANIYGDVCVRRKKQRRKRQKLLVLELLFDYAKNSTLHGLRYIVARGLTIIEKLFWFTTFFVSIVLCAYCIRETFLKWQTSPVIVTVNGKLSSVGTVPFPAVTICPRIKVKPSVYNYTEALRKFKNMEITKPELVKLQHVNMMCDSLLTSFGIEGLKSQYLLQDITEVAQTLNDTFLDCRWLGTKVSCNDLFSKVYTREGICYTANTLAAKDIFKDSIQSVYRYLDSNIFMKGWGVEKGYNYTEPEPFPKRGGVLGSSSDMELVLIHDPDYQDKSCNVLYSGYKIYLQNPADLPQTSLYYYAALSNQITSLAINFHEFNSDDGLKAYPPRIRQCYFPGDRPLRYFKIYTAKNCQAECLSNYTYTNCTCVGFYMPHNDSMQICETYQKLCMAQAKNEMAKNEINNEIEQREEGCRCLPACNTIEYDAEILKTEYNLKDVMSQYSRYKPNNSYSRIDLYYKKPQMVTMQRRELFGKIELLANIGGLLGVFLGFSFLSLVELFYFLTFRVGFTLKRDLEEEKKNKRLQKNGETPS